MVLRPQLVHRTIWNLLDIAGTILQLQSTMEFHRQLLHQHHSQCHLHCGNDPTVANHNGIPSATHPPAPLAIPFTLRERSYSCKSQWNSVDRKCTKHRWNPIYNAEPIRTWSEHDPRMIRPHTRPSRNRRTAEVDHRGSGTDFVWKNIGFRASAISQKRISCETSFKTPSATPPPAPLAIPFTVRERSRVANHNGIPSATHPPAPLAIPFTLRERSYSYKSQWNSVDRKCTKHRWNPIYNADPIRTWSEHDPRMIRPHTRPSRNRRTAEVDHRGSGTDFVWKNIGFRASAISQKRISCETSFKTPSATHPPAPLAIPFTLRERSYSCKSQWNSVDRTWTKHSWNPIYNAEPIRDRSDHDPPMIRPHTRPSRNRRTAEVDHRGSGTDFVWKNIGFRASAISQKRISCETSSKTPSATPPPAPLAIPFTVRERS